MLKPWLVLMLLAGVALAAQERTLWVRHSAFSTVVVTQAGRYRILKFRQDGKDVEESRCDIKRPHYLVHEYSRLQLLGLLFPAQIDDVLVVGLGGGSLTKALAQAYPGATIDSVELDPTVAEAARKWFFYRESKRVRTVLGDARQFLEGTSGRYDVIFLDAFDGLEIPAPLRSRPFYELVRQHLKPQGVAVANLHLRSSRYASDRATLAGVFTEQYAFLGTGLAVVVCQDGPERRTSAWLQAAAESLGSRFPYPLDKLLGQYQGVGEWDRNASPILSP